MLYVLVSISLILFGLSLYLIYAVYREATKENSEEAVATVAPQPPHPEDRSWEPTGKLFNCSTYANIDISSPEVADLKAQVDRYVKTQEFLDLHPQLGIDFSPMPPSQERIDGMKVEFINSSKSEKPVAEEAKKEVSKVEELFDKVKDTDLQTSILAAPTPNGGLTYKPKKARAKKSKDDKPAKAKKTAKKPAKAKKT